MLFPLIVFGILFAWPALERRLTGDQAFHNLLDRPRDAPAAHRVRRRALHWVFVIFLAGASDRVFVLLGLSYQWQINVYRVLAFVGPVVAFFLTRHICRELQQSDVVEERRKRVEAPA